MTRCILLILVVIAISGCKEYNNVRDCDDFKTGTFVWEQESGGQLLQTKFVRTKDIQIEFFEDQIDTSRVEWVNDCEWRVIPIDPKTNADSRAYLFKILNTSGDTYTFEFTQSGRDQIYRGTAKKIG